MGGLGLRSVHSLILGFVAFAIATASGFFVGERLFHADVDRGPASMLFNDDDELVMEDTSLEELQEKRRPRGARVNSVFSPAPGKKLIVTPGEIAHLTGSLQGGVRARAVIFDPAAFLRFVNTSAQAVPLDLFDDVHVVVRFGATPSYGPNNGVYSGGIDADPSARVHLFLSERSLGGTIETSSRKFRILDGGQGLHYVVEERLLKR